VNQNDFPMMLYKAGGAEDIHGGRFHTHIVHDADALEAALADGWHKTTPEAAQASKAAATQGATATAGGEGTDDNAPPTRAELEQKARELNIEFKPNIGDKKLAERIEAALADGADNKE
jgi:hypothetical protein